MFNNQLAITYADSTTTSVNVNLNIITDISNNISVSNGSGTTANLHGIKIKLPYPDDYSTKFRILIISGQIYQAAVGVKLALSLSNQIISNSTGAAGCFANFSLSDDTTIHGGNTMLTNFNPLTFETWSQSTLTGSWATFYILLAG